MISCVVDFFIVKTSHKLESIWMSLKNEVHKQPLMPYINYPNKFRELCKYVNN